MDRSSRLINRINESTLSEKGLISFQKAQRCISSSQRFKPDINDFYCMRCGACCAGCDGLAGDLGKNVKCEFYEHRPQYCREFTASSEECIKCRNFVFGFGSYL